MTRSRKTKGAINARARHQILDDAAFSPGLNEDETYCYCDAWDLTWPHYIAEHTSTHEAAQRQRARAAGGTE